MSKLLISMGLTIVAISVVGVPIAYALSLPAVIATLLALPGAVAAVAALDIYRRVTKNTRRWNRWQKNSDGTLAGLRQDLGELKQTSTELTRNVAEVVKKVDPPDATPLRTRLNRALSAGAIKKGGKDYLHQTVQPLLNKARPDEMTSFTMWQAERHGLSVRKALSFRAQLITMSESKRVKVLQPSWRLNTKNAAYGFIDSLNVRRPASDRKPYPLSEAPLRIPGVVKALHSSGSRGSYLFFSDQHIVHVQDGKMFGSINEFQEHAESFLSGGAGRTLRDQWMVEELILEDVEKKIPARNLKFYCFYGESVLVQESRREPDLEVAFWSADRTMVSTGRYEANAFDGLGFTPAHKELVEQISREIPFPFVRIDMLHGEDELVFGEFTPRPGNFDHFNDHWDRTMGEAWVRAESRILEDLLNGKDFSRFLSSTKMLAP